MVVTIIGFTKHYYIEGQRIVSKIGEPAEFQHIFPADTVIPAGGDSIDWDLKGQALKEAIYANFEALGLEGAVFTAGKSGKVPYGQLKKYYRNSNLVGGGNSNTQTDTIVSNKFEKFQYFYHPDHLGSSSFITDASGEAQQHMEYFPFGETFIEEHHGHDRYSNYKFNAKELDEETGLYYYGARYYDPRISMWYGVDPMAEKYPAISPFIYTANNPLRFIDPDGADIVIAGENNSSVTLTTDMIDITVNASSLGIDFGGSYTLQGEAVLSAGLDIVGIVDPTGVADGLNAALQAKNGEWGGAIISGIGLIPYIGDIAKVGKVGKDVKIIKNAIKAVNGNSKASKKAQHLYEIFETTSGSVVKTGVSGGKVTKSGKSYRATSQVNKWNKVEGVGKYDSRIVQEIPASPGARQKILEAEKANAKKLQQNGHLQDPVKHKNPR